MENPTFAAPGEYRILEGNVLSEKPILSEESISCLISDVVRVLECRTIIPKESLIVFTKTSEVMVTLNRNPSQSVFTTRIHGNYSLSEPITRMRVNGEGWVPSDLARFVRANPHIFPEANALFKALTFVKSSKFKQTNAAGDMRGNLEKDITVKTTSNLPESVTYIVPLTTAHGAAERKLYIELSAEDDLVYLVDPGLNKDLNDWIQLTRESVMEAADRMLIPYVRQ